MNNLEKIYHNILLPLNDVLFKINNQGLLIDVDYLNEMTKWYESELKSITVSYTHLTLPTSDLV